MSKNVYRAGEVQQTKGDVLLGERPGITKLRTRYLRDIEDELARVQRELAEFRATYEGEAKCLAESYGIKKAALEADLAEIRRQSESESKRIRDTAATAVDAEKKRGYDEGLTRGRKEGEEAAAKEIANLLAETREQISRARQTFLDRVQASESKLLDTALTIAERVVHRKIQVDPDVVVEAVREAMAQIQQNHPVRIRVHPADIERIDKFQKMSPEVFKNLQATFIPDETITPGGCIAETGLEFIDATVDKKLETLRERLIPRTLL